MRTARCVCVCIVSFVLAGLASATDWQVVYQNDFSTDPGWTTNSPTYNYWNSTGQNYHTTTFSSGGQYAYTPVSFVQGNSYKLEFDLSVANVAYHGGRIIFGLGDSDMARYVPATFYVGYWNSGSGSEHYRGNVLGEFYMNSEGATYHPVFDPIEYFSANTWYHNVLIYDYDTATLSLTVTKQSDGSILGTQVKTGVGTFLGVDRLYISSIGTDTSSGLIGEGYIDNVTLYTVPEPATIGLFALAGLLIKRKK